MKGGTSTQSGCSFFPLGRVILRQCVLEHPAVRVHLVRTLICTVEFAMGLATTSIGPLRKPKGATLPGGALPDSSALEAASHFVVTRAGDLAEESTFQRERATMRAALG